MEDINIFPKGSHVVLLSSCTGGNNWPDSIPIGYCYKLKQNSHTYNFMVDKDINGSRDNGWNHSEPKDTIKFLRLRQATPEESAEYERLGKPYDVTKANLVPQIKNNYPLF